ncbi:hypothetical protein [Parasphingorhabdus marina]|nr:hypothetical protein [Parasphingorhabdus marina]
MAAVAHQDDHPSQSGTMHNVVVDMQTVESLGLAEPPRREALFKLSLDEAGAVESCTPRFQKRDSAIGAEMCSRLQLAISWQQDLRRDQHKLVRKQSIKLAWPKRSSQDYLSDFGGTMPINMDGWIHNSEIRTLNGFDTGETDFRIELEISEHGRTHSCSTRGDSVPDEFATLLCDQLLSHAFWIPRVDHAGNRVAARANISARLIMTDRGCRRGLTIGMDQRHGRMEIRSAPRHISCGSSVF